MTRRGRKRVALVLIAGAAVAPVVLGAVAVQKVRKERRLTATLERGLESYRAHDYDAALRELAFYVRRREGNAEALLALADTRRRLPIDNEKHISTAINLAQQAAAA